MPIDPRQRSILRDKPRHRLDRLAVGYGDHPLLPLLVSLGTADGQPRTLLDELYVEHLQRDQLGALQR